MCGNLAKWFEKKDWVVALRHVSLLGWQIGRNFGLLMKVCVIGGANVDITAT